MSEPRADQVNVDATVADDTEGHRLAANDNETIEADEDEPETTDTEGHRLAANDNETVVVDESD